MEKSVRKKMGVLEPPQVVLGHKNYAALNPTWKNLGISKGDISHELISPLLLSKGHRMRVREWRDGHWEQSEDTQKVDPKFLISSPASAPWLLTLLKHFTSPPPQRN